MKKEKKEDVRIKAIFFDIGGILLKERSFVSADEEFIKTFDLKQIDLSNSIKKHLTHAQIGKYSSLEFPNNVAKDLKIKNKKLFIKIWKKHNDYSFGIDKGIENIVIRLKKHYVVGCLTNVSGISDECRNKLNVYKHFKFRFISHKIGLRKPDPEFYRLMIKKTRYDPKEIIFIDDKKEFLLPAKKLGINTILFKNNQELKKDLKKVGVKI